MVYVPYDRSTPSERRDTTIWRSIFINAACKKKGFLGSQMGKIKENGGKSWKNHDFSFGRGFRPEILVKSLQGCEKWTLQKILHRYSDPKKISTFFSSTKKYFEKIIFKFSNFPKKSLIDFFSFKSFCWNFFLGKFQKYAKFQTVSIHWKTIIQYYR